MRADVFVDTPEQYAAWLKSQSQQAAAAAPKKAEKLDF
jgi:hypothetical protein